MKRQRLIGLVVVFAVLTVAPALKVCVPITPELMAAHETQASGSPSRSVTGRLTGVMPQMIDEECKPAEGEFEYLYNIYEIGPDGAAVGSSHWRARALNPPSRWMELYVAVDCLKFAEVDGKPAAIYSGKIIKGTPPQCFIDAVCAWEDHLKIGMVTDGGTGGDGDEIVYWGPVPRCFFPDDGEPLGCVVPEGSQESSFTVTGGDVVVRAP